MAAAKIKLAALGTGIWYASKSFNSSSSDGSNAVGCDSQQCNSNHNNQQVHGQQKAASAYTPFAPPDTQPSSQAYVR